MSDFTTSSTQKARKPHRCEHCRKTIEVGDLYMKSAGVCDGDFFSWKEHLMCREAWIARRELSGLGYSEPSPALADDELEEEDREWLKDEFPIVHERLFSKQFSEAAQ